MKAEAHRRAQTRVGMVLLISSCSVSSNESILQNVRSDGAMVEYRIASGMTSISGSRVYRDERNFLLYINPTQASGAPTVRVSLVVSCVDVTPWAL